MEFPKINFKKKKIPNKEKKKNKKNNNNASEEPNEDEYSFDEIEISPSVFDEEDQTFIQNGIVIEPKFDLTDIEK